MAEKLTTAVTLTSVHKEAIRRGDSMPLITREAISKSLEAIAMRYPQYVDYAAGWGDAIALKDYSTKGGLAMLKGDAVLVNWESEELGGRRRQLRPFVIIWSARRSVAIAVDKRYLRRRDQKEARF